MTDSTPRQRLWSSSGRYRIRRKRSGAPSPQGHLIEEWLMANDFQPVVGHRFSASAPSPRRIGAGSSTAKFWSSNLTARLSYSWGALGLGSIGHVDTDADRGRHTTADGAIRLPVRQKARLQGCKVRLAEVHRQPGAGAERAHELTQSRASNTHRKQTGGGTHMNPHCKVRRLSPRKPARKPTRSAIGFSPRSSASR